MSDQREKPRKKEVDAQGKAQLIAAITRCRAEVAGILGLQATLGRLVYVHDALKDMEVLLDTYELRK